MNPQQMVQALKVPEKKLAKRDLDSAAQRVVTLKEAAGRRRPTYRDDQGRTDRGLRPKAWASARAPGAITDREESLARQHFDDEIGRDEFVREIDNPGPTPRRGSGELYRVRAARSTPTSSSRARPTVSLQRVLLSGDFFVTPPRIVFDLEAALAGTRIEDIDETVERFFTDNEVGMLSVLPGDFKAAIADAIGKRVERHG